MFRVATRLRFIEPQRASPVDQPPEGKHWIHEIKHDGYRSQVVIERGQVRVFSRNGHDWSDRYAGIVRAAAGLRCKSAIIDGETIVQDSDGRSDFEAKAFGGEQDAPSCDGEALGDLAAVVGVALFTSLPSSIPFIENNIGLIEFAREKVT